MKEQEKEALYRANAVPHPNDAGEEDDCCRVGRQLAHAAPVVHARLLLLGLLLLEVLLGLLLLLRWQASGVAAATAVLQQGIILRCFCFCRAVLSDGVEAAKLAGQRAARSLPRLVPPPPAAAALLLRL